jgi:hypothetical protein
MWWCKKVVVEKPPGRHKLEGAERFCRLLVLLTYFYHTWEVRRNSFFVGISLAVKTSEGQGFPKDGHIVR